MSDYTPLRQERDVGTTVEHAVNYFRDQFKPMVRALAVILGPLLGLAALLQAGTRIFMADVLAEPELFFTQQASLDTGTILYVLFSGGVNIILFVLLIAAVYSYIRLDEQSDADAPPDPASVWEETRQHIASVIFGGLMYSLAIFLGVLLVTVIVGIALIAFSEVLAAVMAGIAFFVVLVLLSIRLTLFMPALVLEDKGPLQALERSWTLTKGAFWKTFGMLFIASMLVFIAALVLVLPSTITEMAGLAFGANLTVLLIGFDLISLVGTYLVYPIFYLALAMHYYSRCEQRDYVALKQRIDALDNDTESSSDRFERSSTPDSFSDDAFSSRNR